MDELEPDCGRCVGLCCVALPFSRGEAFAFGKDAGEPCRHLDVGDGCAIHSRLSETGMAGCAAYECFGAGQFVVQVSYAGVSWRDLGGRAGEMYAVFAVVQRLHEMLVLLDQAIVLAREDGSLVQLRTRIAAARALPVASVLAEDVDRWAATVGESLRRVSQVVRGADAPSYAGADLAGRDLRSVPLGRADLRGALLIGADLRAVHLERADLLGADLRGAHVAGADLSATLFLTQPQVNVAAGDATTRLPASVRRPRSWA